MSSLYPPYIEGKIATQYGDTLRIPYQLNRALGLNEIKSVHARVKDIVSNEIINGITLETSNFKKEISKGVYEASFSLINKDSEQQLLFGEQSSYWKYYKIQLAFNGINGSWSTVGVFKYSQKPTVKILGLQENSISYNTVNYTGRYESEDASEKVYKYKFDLYENGVLLETSDWCLHNSTKDESPNYSTDNFNISFELQKENNYQLFYIVQTNNGLIISSPGYYIKNQIYYEADYNFGLKAINDPENGYIKLSLIRTKEDNNRVYGRFKLLRREVNKNQWNEIDDLILDTEIPESGELDLDKDYTVRQGIKYEYSIMRYSESLYQKRLCSDEIICNFEDAFLYDGNRQLRIRFNPKVDSFKNTILESKMDTIGGVYPFIFRNGRTNYKEFSISGLISLLMDENFTLIKDNERVDYGLPTDLTFNNIKNEREFKLEVLNWLTNGKPKLFRSPTEGNYIVRLMNISLSPNATLGRMLHTFNCTAYEIAEMSYNNLVFYGFTKKLKDKTDKKYSKVYDLSNYQIKTTLNLRNASKIIITNATPGAEFSFSYDSGYSTNIIIGPSKYYKIEVNDENDFINSFTFNPIYAGIVEIFSEGDNEYHFTENEDLDWYLSKIQETEKVRQITSGLNFNPEKQESIENEEKIENTENNIETKQKNLQDILLGDSIIIESAIEKTITKLKQIKYIKIRSKDLVYEGPNLPTCINITEKDKFNFKYSFNGIEHDEYLSTFNKINEEENFNFINAIREFEEPTIYTNITSIENIGDGLIADIYYIEQKFIYKTMTE